MNFTPNSDAEAEADGFLALAEQFEEAIEAIEGLIESVQTAAAGGLSDTVGLTFPILDNPLSVVSLFLPDAVAGDDVVTFVEYDLPALVVQAQVGDFFFPVLGPIGINLGGNFEAGIDFKIAYDSTGLTNPGADGFTPDDLLKGLVLKPTSPGAPVGYINSEITAGVGVNLVVVKAFVEGGLTGNVGAYFPNDELRYDTVADGCIFDPISGQIGADLRHASPWASDRSPGRRGRPSPRRRWSISASAATAMGRLQDRPGQGARGGRSRRQREPRSSTPEPAPASAASTARRASTSRLRTEARRTASAVPWMQTAT